MSIPFAQRSGRWWGRGRRCRAPPERLFQIACFCAVQHRQGPNELPLRLLYARPEKGIAVTTTRPDSVDNVTGAVSAKRGRSSPPLERKATPRVRSKKRECSVVQSSAHLVWNDPDMNKGCQADPAGSIYALVQHRSSKVQTKSPGYTVQTAQALKPGVRNIATTSHLGPKVIKHWGVERGRNLRRRARRSRLSRETIKNWWKPWTVRVRVLVAS